MKTMMSLHVYDDGVLAENYQLELPKEALFLGENDLIMVTSSHHFPVSQKRLNVEFKTMFVISEIDRSEEEYCTYNKENLKRIGLTQID